MHNVLHKRIVKEKLRRSDFMAIIMMIIGMYLSPIIPNSKHSNMSRYVCFNLFAGWIASDDVTHVLRRKRNNTKHFLIALFDDSVISVVSTLGGCVRSKCMPIAEVIGEVAEEKRTGSRFCSPKVVGE